MRPTTILFITAVLTVAGIAALPLARADAQEAAPAKKQPFVPQVPQAACLRERLGTGAPAQHGALLEPYPVRPAWRVAGVDYAVGHYPGEALKDPKSLTGPGIGYDAPRHILRIDNISGLVIDGYDFSRDSIGLWLVNAPNTTIKNSKFAFSLPDQGTYAIYANDHSRNLYVGCNTIDGGTSNASGLIYALAPNVTVEGNWMVNAAQHFLEVIGGGDLSYRFNLLENGGRRLGAHLNYLQLGEARYSSYSVLYNTVFQTPQPGGGEVFQFYMDGKGGLIVDPEIAWNTIIALPEGDRKAVSYALNGAREPVVSRGAIHDNYFDASGMYGPFYPVPKDATNPTFAHNVDLRTGKAFADPIPMPQIP